MENQLKTLKELASYLGVKESWVRSKVFKNEIPYIKVGRLIRFNMNSIEAWLKTNFKGPSPPD